jgi:hypothetical protein
MRTQQRWLRATVVLLALVPAGCGGLEKGGVTEVSTPNRGVYPPSSTPYGKTYGEWGDDWWKLILSIPRRDHPVLDETGEKAGVGQSGPVWFLYGTFGTSVERTCTVPSDKAIFFPLYCASFWIPTDGDTPEIIRAGAIRCIDATTELEASVDGVALNGLGNYRFHSPDFYYFTGPSDDPDPVFVGGMGTHLAYGDGYWVMLEPLSPGEHTVWFHAKSVYPATFPNVQVFEVTVTYHLTVE